VERGDFIYRIEAERLSGKLLADLSYVTITDVFHVGLHEYLDTIQLRLIEIGNAVYKEFCEWLDTTNDNDRQRSTTIDSER
jgi:uncharacterized alpha-E superfamily protein